VAGHSVLSGVVALAQRAQPLQLMWKHALARMRVHALGCC